MTAADLKHLHPNDVVLWLHVEAAVWRLAKAAHIKIADVQPTRVSEMAGAYGVCDYYTHGAPVISISLRHGLGYRTRISEWRIIETIAHELAHAKVGWRASHGPAFTRAHGRLLLLAEKLKLRVDIAKSGVKLPE